MKRKNPFIALSESSGNGDRQKAGLVEQVRRHLPIQWKSPNHIEPTTTWMAFLMTVLVGAKRFPTDDTICNLFRKFGMGEIQRFFEPMTEWQAAAPRGLYARYGFHRV
ncbi:MAG: hypothetical protein SGI92_12405 [Bryobacteraceae bacterium]|nr:hypothetical protein [Bryobacteraceae bacterium]